MAFRDCREVVREAAAHKDHRDYREKTPALLDRKASKDFREVAKAVVAFKVFKASKAQQHRRIFLRDFKKTRS
jgi:phage terminase small subunit